MYRHDFSEEAEDPQDNWPGCPFELKADCLEFHVAEDRLEQQYDNERGSS